MSDDCKLEAKTSPYKPMPTQLAEAINESIARWKTRVKTLTDATPEDCPLCRLFNPNMIGAPLSAGCNGCPVKEKSGEDYCKATPVIDYTKALVEKRTTAAAQAAMDEVRFLESLREPALDWNGKLEMVHWNNKSITPCRVICRDLKGAYPYVIAYENDGGESLMRADERGKAVGNNKIRNVPTEYKLLVILRKGLNRWEAYYSAFAGTNDKLDKIADDWLKKAKAEPHLWYAVVHTVKAPAN